MDPWLDRARLRGHRRQWGLLVGGCTGPDSGSADRFGSKGEHLHSGALVLDGLRPLLPPTDRFWADPFLCHYQGRHQLFFEELRDARGRGAIMTLALDGEGRPIEETARTALELPEHLSYPFVFEYQGALYLLPECGERRRLDLYGCVRFPDRWEPVQTLMAGVKLKDCTLLEHGGYWWLFCAQARGRQRINETLVAFYAEQPLTDRWNEHSQNPIRRDFASARPGGRIQCDAAGRLLRPAQNAVPRYGYGLSMQEILELTPERYRERCLWRTHGPEHGWQGLHHIDWCEGLLALDVQRLI